MKDDQTIKDFLSRDLLPLTNPDFGSQNFNDVKIIFGELRDLIVDMIEIGTTIKLPSGIEGQVITFASIWNSFHTNIRNYNLVNDGQNRFNQRQTIIISITNWYNACFTGFDSQNGNRTNNFLLIYGAVKGLANKDISSYRIRLNQLIIEFEKKRKDVDEITNELRKKSGDQTISDYAEIFKKASENHSFFSIRPKFKIGSAEKWLALGIVMIGVFSSTIIKLNDWLGINFNSSEPGLLTIQIISRLLILSIWVYVISFCLKQYSVNKHLSTLNKHRQNTLDSYKLFLQSIDPTDGITKNALMMEVAKSIYEHGSTGHLTSKNADSNPSIIELTRFVNQSNR
jgi:hypothetical protein